MHNNIILLKSPEAQNRAFTLALVRQKVCRRLDGTFGSIDADCFVAFRQCRCK